LSLKNFELIFERFADTYGFAVFCGGFEFDAASGTDRVFVKGFAAGRLCNDNVSNFRRLIKCGSQLCHSRTLTACAYFGDRLFNYFDRRIDVLLVIFFLIGLSVRDSGKC